MSISRSKMNRPKRKKRFFSTNLMIKKRKDLFFSAGLKGFLCTCNGNEKQCIREAYNILNEYADSLYGEENKSQNNGSKLKEVDNLKESIDNDDEMDAFQKEVGLLKQETKSDENRRFKAVDTGVLNCIFIKTNLQDPCQLAATIAEDLAKSKQLKSRFLIRLVPIELTCKAYIDDIVTAAKSLFDLHLKTDPVSYGIVFMKRCCSHLNRGEVIDKLAAMVKELNNDHKVNLNNPDVTILVEVVKNVCGLAVIRNFNNYCKYNLRQICGEPEQSNEETSYKVEYQDTEAAETKIEDKIKVTNAEAARVTEMENQDL